MFVRKWPCGWVQKVTPWGRGRWAARVGGGPLGFGRGAAEGVHPFAAASDSHSLYGSISSIEYCTCRAWMGVAP